MAREKIEFDSVLYQGVVIPGIPPFPERALAEAESLGERQPTYNAREISKTFFQSWSPDHYLYKKLRKSPLPPLGTDLFFTHPRQTAFGERSGQTWTLGEVERMIIWYYSVKAITYNQYITSRQIVVWIARGFGIYYG